MRAAKNSRMTPRVSDAAFLEFLDDFVQSTQKAMPLGSDLDAYFPTLWLEDRAKITIAVLAGEDGQHLESHDMLLQMMRDFGEQHFRETKRWPQAVGVAYRDEDGLTIWGCTEVGRAALRVLEYSDVAISVQRHAFGPATPGSEGIARNPAAWFYASGPLKSLMLPT